MVISLRSVSLSLSLFSPRLMDFFALCCVAVSLLLWERWSLSLSNGVDIICSFERFLEHTYLYTSISFCSTGAGFCFCFCFSLLAVCDLCVLSAFVIETYYCLHNGMIIEETWILARPWFPPTACVILRVMKPCFLLH